MSQVEVEKKNPGALADFIVEILACPLCSNTLQLNSKGYECMGCGETYLVKHGQPDFRLTKKKTVPLEIEIGEPLLPPGGFSFDKLKPNPNPEVDYTGVKVPWHLTRTILSYFVKAKSPDSVVLDLGCGRAIHREVCEHAGYKYVGFDYGEPDAPMLADGHALPFKDNSFDFIISINVLEHIQNPFVMMSEAFRVLKPGGSLIGTVAFLEPFHQSSFYHHTHFGTYNTLKTAGFDVKRVAPNENWLVLKAQAKMLFNRLPVTVSELIVSPVYYMHRAWWKVAGLLSKKATETYRLLLTAGSFRFIAQKPL